MMTRKHYIALAGALRDAMASCAPIGKPDTIFAARVIEYVMDVLKTDNPRFDRDRFVEACGKGAK